MFRKSLAFLTCCLFLNVFNTASARTIEEIADANKNSVVRVEVTMKGEKPSILDMMSSGKKGWSGSGFFITKDVILTNSHVVLDEQSLEDIDSVTEWLQRLDSSKSFEYKILLNNKVYYAKPLGYDTLIDAGLLKIYNPPANAVPVTLGDSDALHVGQSVIAMGSPLGLQDSVTSGIISALHRRVEIGLFPLEDSIQTDAVIAPGSSGSPLINMAGEVVGINNAGVRGVNIGFTIPINLVKKYIPRMLAGEKIRSGKHGISVLTQQYERSGNIEDLKTLGDLLDEKDVQTLMRIDDYLKNKGGALVTNVDGNSLAHGLFARGDIIIAFNGQAIKDGFELQTRLAEAETGKEYNVTVLRMQNGEQTLQLKLNVESTSSYFKRLISSQF